MLLTTTSQLDGFVITQYLGVVAGEAAVAPVELRDFANFIHREGGGRHPEFENLIRQTRQIALMNLESEAREVGADAVVAVNLQYSHLAADGLIMIAAIGTAVQTTDRRKL
ncbi:MAG: YbjQ family protein [Planctomycetes bacterium]|nr:YbjQ family protein [Planctomycetota bacterium]